ncbi:hypothetical protein PK35_02820 [Tamlana nanhaiensis]|uniref:Secretion system C-terminal sorting domain-containing protein n=2 Tax=Neotamlana nanhaiensis TaxID=1382798 RepID=A0A0D7W6N3_9FLAO|nr:hypothetical protein PK35_02820 [Tamlana nanhaiensis]
MAQTTQPFLVEAESGSLGSDYTTGTDGGITYVYPQTNFLSTSYPGTADKVITYNITFPEADTYDLYVKIYIGPEGNNDDSFYVAQSFGTKVETDSNDWVNMNRLDESGHTAGTDVVSGDMQSQIIEQWKWINLSQLWANGTNWTYTVNPGSLSVTYQIGAREDGLFIDKLVFGKTGTSYTVDELEAATTLSSKKYDTLDNTVTVYPNPSKGSFNIDSNEYVGVYKIYSLIGAKVEEGAFGLGLTSYGENLKSGTYVLDLQANNKRSVTKIVKL